MLEDGMRPIRVIFAACAVAIFFFNAELFAQTAAKPATVIQAGSLVAFDYTLTDETGNVIDSSQGKEPMHYVHGKGQIIPGLEKELTGMSVGAEKKVTVKPEDGYGPVKPEAFQEIPKDKLPPEALKVGTVLTAHGPNGQSVPVRVHEVKENTVVIDFNHPLAGKTLLFDVKVTEVKPANP
jgi:FKBP-type peptidyl-prolyl cis-trans isomerase SlyD